MRAPEMVTAFSAGIVLAAITGAVVSTGTAVPIALGMAVVLGAWFRRRPYLVGLLLLGPITVMSLILLAARSRALVPIALVADGAAALLLGLVAAGAALLGEVLLGERGTASRTTGGTSSDLV